MKLACIKKRFRQKCSKTKKEKETAETEEEARSKRTLHSSR